MAVTVPTLARTPVAGPVAASPGAARGPVHVLLISACAVLLFAGFVLFGLGGWSYYTTPAAVRGYAPAHPLLRPSGTAGQLFGIGGFVFMLVPVAYAMRKRIQALRGFGSMKTWIDVHVFCGIVGPVLVTFHTSFKFNGIVSVAYWSMMMVALSGVVGRYLYVRIPRSLRGLELTRAELDERAQALSAELVHAGLPDSLLAAVSSFEQRVVPRPGAESIMGLLTGEMTMRRDITHLRRTVKEAGVAPALLESAIRVIAEHASLLRYTAYMNKTKQLFDVWHVFHMPLVYVMFLIVVLHVAVTLYMGYVPFRF
jgi:hypothetical protein